MSTVTGGCLCGAVRYTYDGEVGLASVCHCSDCRHVSGSAFGVGIRLRSEGFRLLQGELRGYTKAGDSGRELTRYICINCGSPLYTASPHHPDVVFVRAGSLDDPDIVRLSHQAWTRSAVAWGVMPPDLPSFPNNRTA